MLGHLLGEWGYPAALMFVHPLRSHFARSRPLRDAKGRFLGGLFCFLECG